MVVKKKNIVTIVILFFILSCSQRVSFETQPFEKVEFHEGNPFDSILYIYRIDSKKSAKENIPLVLNTTLKYITKGNHNYVMHVDAGQYKLKAQLPQNKYEEDEVIELIIDPRSETFIRLEWVSKANNNNQWIMTRVDPKTALGEIIYTDRYKGWLLNYDILDKQEDKPKKYIEALNMKLSLVSITNKKYNINYYDERVPFTYDIVNYDESGPHAVYRFSIDDAEQKLSLTFDFDKTTQSIKIWNINLFGSYISEYFHISSDNDRIDFASFPDRPLLGATQLYSFSNNYRLKASGSSRYLILSLLISIESSDFFNNI